MALQSSIGKWQIFELEIKATYCYRLLDVDGWGDGSHRFDTIACLNLLDRCSHPLTMLRQIKQALQITRGRLVLGLVLPLDQHNEQGE